jgi:serine phosphatase RsbU (regulator of sigma subunit)
MASIRYSQNIQNSILPQALRMRESLNDYFLIFRPKDIVSGDFYWHNRFEDTSVVAVVDCTGHGVPGSLLSAMGVMHLNRIINETGILDPADILAALDERMQAVFGRQGKGMAASEGMDVCLCAIEHWEHKVTFAGAKRPLYHASGDDLVQVNGDRKAIGDGRDRSFTNRVIECRPGDILYLMTDGFADQNDAEGRRYGSGRLRDFLKGIVHLDMAEQEQSLLEEMKRHQGHEEQRDDITLMGIRIGGRHE